MSEAPNFRAGSDYPNGGELIGPAWQRVWEELEDGRWYHAPELSRIMAEETGIRDSTAMNLLRQARKYGHLEVRYERYGNRRQAEYRRP